MNRISNEILKLTPQLKNIDFQTLKSERPGSLTSLVQKN